MGLIQYHENKRHIVYIWIFYSKESRNDIKVKRCISAKIEGNFHSLLIPHLLELREAKDMHLVQINLQRKRLAMFYSNKIKVGK